MPQRPQVWAHSVCTRAKLREVFADESITAIEADILVGDVMGLEDITLQTGVPIMCHPPKRRSDLCFQSFLETCTKEGRHNLKLDFKEIAAVWPCLPLVAQLAPQLKANGQAVWINADILPGPGKRVGEGAVPTAEFFNAVLALCPGVPLSLGWRVNIVHFSPYTQQDCEAMVGQVRAYHERLQAGGCRPGGVVFATSLRLTALSLGTLRQLLLDVPGSQLLAWTGTGEAAVHPSVVNQVQAGFEAAGLGDRVSFDCQVAQASARARLVELGLCVGGVCARACSKK